MFALFACFRAWPADLRYTISVRPPDGIHVALRVSGAAGDSLTVAMPVWLPGYYRRLDLQRHIANLVVSRDGQPVGTTTPAPGCWRFGNVAGRPVTVEYDVAEYDAGFANRGEETLGQMGVYVDSKSAFVHPGAALVYVDGLTDNPATVALETPPGWDVATPLGRRADGLFEAPDYEALNDSPIQMGAFRCIRFATRNRQFEIIATGSSKVSSRALREVVEPIAAAGLDLFEGWAPFDRYQFHFHFPPKRRWGGPGLEHRQSCVIVFDGSTDDRRFRKNCWSIIAHEYLHAWNVRALRPEGLLPLDYRNEAVIPSLWFSEGVTEYYAKIVGVRSGLATPAEAIADLNGDYAAYLASPGRATTSLAEASRRVWENGSSSGGGGTNYYAKGALTGLLLDARIRAATGGAKSLDDALRLLVRDYAMRNRAFPPEALPAAIREAAGVDVSPEYRIAVETAEDLPLADVLPAAGIVVESRNIADPVMGLEFDPGDRELVVRRVAPKSAADEAHIEVGDVILTIDGEPAAGRVGRGPAWGGNRNPGDRVEVIMRRGLEKQVIVVKVKAKTVTALKPADAPTPSARKVFESFWRPDRPARRAPEALPDA